MAPTLVDTSYASTYYPATKKLKPSETKPLLEDISALQIKSKYEKLLGIDKSVAWLTPASPGTRSDTISGARVNIERVWEDLHYMQKWNDISQSKGLKRPAKSAVNKPVRDWFVREAKVIGCEIKIDSIGNVFAILPGENMELAPIGIGGNVDTEPAEGRSLDSLLRVLAGLEVLRSIKEAGFKTHAPVAAIIWTRLEGLHLDAACFGSELWSGQTSLSVVHQLCGDDEKTIKSELQENNYLGPSFADHRINPLSAYLELHFEQESEPHHQSQNADVINGIQIMRWYEVNVTGVRGYAGLTPMEDRADALVATSSIITFVTEEAMKRSALATVGVLQMDPPVSCTIIGSVTFTIDVRCRSKAGLDDMEKIVKDKMALMTFQCPKLSFQMTKICETPAVQFDSTLTTCIRSVVTEEAGEDSCLETKSFAGYDSAMTASCGVQTANIFVSNKVKPYKNQISASKEDCGQGIQILLDSVLKYDSLIEKHIELHEINFQLPDENMRGWEN